MPVRMCAEIEGEMTEAELAVSKAGSAILLLAISEPDSKHMMKVATILHRRHIRRFRNLPRRGLG